MKKIAALYRASYTGLSPASWWLSFVILINRSGTMVVPFMTLYLTTRLGVSLTQAGIVMGIFGAGAVCGGFLGGRLCSIFGFYNVQLVTLLGGGLMFLVLGYMESFPLICVTTFILSVINESFRPANSLAIAHYSDDGNRTRSFSLNRLATNIGWALGGSLGGFLAAKNYHLLFIIDGCTNIFAAVLLKIFLAPARADKTRAGIHKSVPKAVRFEAYKDKHYLFFCFLLIIYAYTFFQLFSTLPVFYKQHLHLREEMIGLTMTANGILIALIEMVLIFKLEGRRAPVHYIKWGTLLLGLSFMIFNLVPATGNITSWLTAGMLLAMVSTLIVTFGEMLSMPFMNTYWINRTTHDNRSGYAGLYTVSWAVAQVLGWWTGPMLADKIGFTAFWWIIGANSVVAAGGFWLLQQWSDEKKIPAVAAGTDAAV